MAAEQNAAEDRAPMRAQEVQLTARSNRRCNIVASPDPETLHGKAGSHHTTARNHGRQGMHPRIFRYVVAGKILLKIAFQLEEPVTRATSGGKSGGGVAITAFRESLIKSYRELGHDIEMAAARRLPSIARVVVQNHKIKSEIAAPSVGTEILRNQQPPVISTPVVLTVGSAL